MFKSLLIRAGFFIFLEMKLFVLCLGEKSVVIIFVKVYIGSRSVFF